MAVEITEVRIKLMEESGDRLRAFCSITFDDCFVIRDLKIIEGSSGPFVAMPSRKLTARCPQCGMKNHMRAGYCNNCGLRMNNETAQKEQEGRAKLYADIAHPINSACREMIQNRVVEEYQAELERSAQPGYRSRYDDYFDDEEYEAESAESAVTAPSEDDTTTGGESTTGRESAETSASPLERPLVEPATVEPRPPHTSPSRQSSRRPTQRPEHGKFGQGIFDE
jgi:stage V sporulation protein G